MRSHVAIWGKTKKKNRRYRKTKKWEKEIWGRGKVGGGREKKIALQRT